MIRGIPKRGLYSVPKTEKNVEWPYSIQEHDADRAGKHFDLRLGKQGLSWAIRNWPDPGQKSLATQTDDHSLDYYNFEGTIPEGYGKGKVKLQETGKVNIIKSTPDKISFFLKDRYLPKRYSLIRTAQRKWLLINHTPTEDSRPEIPRTKPKYKKIKNLKDYMKSDDYIFSPKYDGAANVVVLRNQKHPEIFSYRKGKTGLIDHTFKLNFDKHLAKTKTSKPTVVWAETLSMKNNKPKHVSETSGLLNASLDKARHSKDKFKNIAYNINMYEGKDVSDLPYEKKIDLLKTVVKQNKFLQLPELKTKPSHKANLLKDIQSKKHKLTSEGIIVFDKKKSIPLKSKFNKEFSVYIRGVAQGKGKFKNSLGGLQYSHTKTGPISGIVGGGFTEEERKDIFNNPNKYIGQKAKIQASEKLKSNSLRMPIFINFEADEWPKN